MPQITNPVQQTIDTEVDYIFGLEKRLERDFNRSEQKYVEPVEELIKIDSTSDCFGTIFRVWRGKSVLGIFYQAASGNGWIAEAFQPKQHPQWCASDEQALELIKSAW